MLRCARPRIQQDGGNAIKLVSFKWALALTVMVRGCTKLADGRPDRGDASIDGGGGGIHARPPVREQLGGRACAADDACRSGHCENGFCCEEGVCCAAADDCPAGFSRASRCGRSGDDTDCQGQRLDAVCRENRCVSVAIDDDSGCAGSQRSCAGYAPVRCSDDIDQDVALYTNECSSTAGCSGRYVCIDGSCEAPVGSCQSCGDASDCQGNLQCGQGSCCAADFGQCCGDDRDCGDGFGCDPVTCGCYDSCLSDGDRSHCAAGYVCVERQCVALKAPGEACEETFECASGHCVDDVCCGEACDEACHACNAEGQCEAEAPGTACGDPNDADCDAPDTCDEQARCVDNVAPVVRICRPADSAEPECDRAETCDGSSKVCPDDAAQPVDTPCGDSSNAACDAPDSCDDAGHCVDRVAPDTRVCRAAASACDVAESCDGSLKACPSDLMRADGATCAGDPGRCCNGVCDTDGIAGGDLAGACRSDAPDCVGTGSWGYAAAHENEICAGPTCGCGNCQYATTCGQSGSGQTQCTQNRCQQGACSLVENTTGAACSCTRITEGSICGSNCTGGVEPVCFFDCCQSGNCVGCF